MHPPNDGGRPTGWWRPRNSAGWLTRFCIGGYNDDDHNVDVRRTDQNDGEKYIVVFAHARNVSCGRHLLALGASLPRTWVEI
jgi:hypothetical protein